MSSASTSAGEPLFDVTDETFEERVLDRSVDVPVVVDLWAPWCGPCKTLGPILEKVVDATQGKVELAKVNIDENPRVGAAFQVQSIPAVFALRDRQIVDHFIGALPEAAVQKFVDQLAPPLSPADKLVDLGTEDALRAALDLQPDHAGAVVALADMLVARGDADEALALIARIPETAETRRIAALARTGAAASEGGVAAGGDDAAKELDGLLDRVKDDEDARQRYVDLLEVMGPDDPRTAQYRRALTSRLF